MYTILPPFTFQWSSFFPSSSSSSSSCSSSSTSSSPSSSSYTNSNTIPFIVERRKTEVKLHGCEKNFKIAIRRKFANFHIDQLCEMLNISGKHRKANFFLFALDHKLLKVTFYEKKRVTRGVPDPQILRQSQNFWNGRSYFFVKACRSSLRLGF